MTTKPNDRQDIYTTVTLRIIAALEAGVRPWHAPWTAGNTEGRIVRPLRHNAVPYNGINILILWGEAIENGYRSPFWMTFRQAVEYGGHVRKGEKGTIVVYASTVTRTEEDADGGEKERIIPYLKSYRVFNAEQIEGLPERFGVSPVPAPVLGALEHDPAIDRFFAAIPADVRHGGGRAYYAIDADFIRLPPFEAFESAQAYFATRAHETTHWTRHSTRLNRDFGRKRWGDEGYAMEELVAEMGAAFLGADLGLAPMVMENHAAYVESWLKVLKNDKHAIFTAASFAGKATDYLIAFQAEGKDRAA